MSILNVSMLENSNSFVGKPVKKEISWEVAGKKHKAHIFVKLSSYETAMEEFSIAKDSGQSLMIARILTAVVDEKGKPIFKPENITGDESGNGKLCASLFMALVGAINEANGFVDTNNEELDEKN